MEALCRVCAGLGLGNVGVVVPVAGWQTAGSSSKGASTKTDGGFFGTACSGKNNTDVFGKNLRFLIGLLHWLRSWLHRLINNMVD